MNKQLASHDYVDLKTLVIEGEITSLQNDILDIQDDISTLSGEVNTKASETFVTDAVSSHNISNTSHQDIRNAIPSITGLATETFVTSSISEHNSSGTAHIDIRDSVTNVSNSLSSYVPYADANQSVDLGSNNLSANGLQSLGQTILAKDSGNVLIGTTADNILDKLQVLGSSYIQSGVFTDSIQGTDDGTTHNPATLTLNKLGGNVLIGTDTDDVSNKLQVNGDIRVRSSDSTYGKIHAKDDNNVLLPLRLNPDGGNVLIGTTFETSEKLQVGGDIRVNNNGTHGKILAKDDNNVLLPLQLNPDGGNVLIGTIDNDTVNKLQVNGSTSIAGDLTSTGNISGLNLSGTNTGDQDLEAYKTYAGFENRTDSSISIDASGVFTLSGTSFNIWTNGTGKHILTGTQTVTVTADQTLSYIFIDNTGTLQISITPWDLASGDNIPCAIVFKDGSNYALTEERHSYERNRSWHKWAHFNIGCMYRSGFTGTFTTTTISVTQGVVADEDIAADSLTTKTSTTLWYRNATSGMRMIRNSAVAKGLTAGNILAYDDGSGTLQPVTSNRFVTNWVYATNDPLQPIYTVIGQNDSTTIANARNATSPTINLSTAEWKLIYRVIYQRTAGTPTGIFVEATDFRTVQTGVPTAAVSTDHASLINRDAASSHPAAAISYGVTNVDDALTTLSNGLSAYSTNAYTTSSISDHNNSGAAHTDIRNSVTNVSNSLSAYATQEYVTSSIAAIPSVDLTPYATLSGAAFIGNITATNLSGTNTGDQDLSSYALTSSIVGLVSELFVTDSITAHNEAGASHQDIRNLIVAPQSLSGYAQLSGATFTGDLTVETTLSGNVVKADKFRSIRTIYGTDLIENNYGLDYIPFFVQSDLQADYAPIFNAVGNNDQSMMITLIKTRSIDGNTPGTLSANDVLGGIDFFGDDGEGIVTGGRINMFVEKTVTPGMLHAGMEFEVGRDDGPGTIRALYIKSGTGIVEAQYGINTDGLSATSLTSTSTAHFGSATDYSKFESDGTLTMTGSATVKANALSATNINFTGTLFTSGISGYTHPKKVVLMDVDGDSFEVYLRNGILTLT